LQAGKFEAEFAGLPNLRKMKIMRIPRWIGGLTGLVGIGGLVIGVLVGVPAVGNIDQVFSSNEFCAKTCHTMEPVAAELKESAHGSTHTGVVPHCSDCHVSESLFGAMVDHTKGLHELYSYWIKGIDTPEKLETVRFKDANNMRMHFYETDSANCRGCHVMEKIKPLKKRGQRQHKEAREKHITCIICHYNLVHKETELSKEFDAIVGQY